MVENKQNIANGFKWVAVERISIQIVQFVLGIVIARFVTPEEYGIVGILMTFIIVSEVFIDSGLGSALIYRHDLDNKDVQTTFTFNLAVSSFFYLLMFVGAPYIEIFFKLTTLALYLRVTSLLLLINAIILVPTVILKVTMRFKGLAVTNILATVISGFIGVTAAVYGLGVWALIFQSLSRGLIQLVFLFIICRWKPTFYISYERLKLLYNYGVKVFGASCITKFVDEGTNFFVGKFLSPMSLGLFSRGNQFASLPATSLGNMVSTVLFPSLSAVKNDETAFLKLYRKIIIYQAAVYIPVVLSLVIIAKPLVLLLLTDKWIAVVPIMQILCLGRILSPITNASIQVLLAKGRSDYYMKQQNWKMFVKFSFILCALPFGVYGVAIADMTSTLLGFFITNYFSQKISTYRIGMQLKDIFPYIIAVAVTFLCGYLLLDYLDNIVWQIAIPLVLAWLMYFVVLCFIMRLNTINDILFLLLKR